MTDPYRAEFDALREACENQDAEAFRAHLETLVQLHIAPITSGLAGVVNRKKVELLRAGIHYDSQSLGRWFRAIWTHAEYRPFGLQGQVVEGLWERSYDSVPRGLNQLTDRTVARTAFIQFKGTVRIVDGTTSLHVDAEEYRCLRELLFKLDLFQCISEGLKSAEKKLEDDRVLKRNLDGDDLKFVEGFVAKLKPWVDAWRDGGVPKQTDKELLLSFLLTWYPTLTCAIPKRLDTSSQVVVLLPFPETRPPAFFATIGCLFAVKPGTAVKWTAVENYVLTAFKGILYRLIAVDAQVVGGHTPRVTLALERAVRALQFVTPTSVEQEDRWAEWRRVFPTKGTLPAASARWDVPIWGASDEIGRLLRGLKDLLKNDGRDKNKHGVELVFLYSPPGCGKENIARLCHYLSGRSLKREYISSAYGRVEKLFKDVKPVELFETQMGQRRLHQRSDEVKNIKAWCEDPNLNGPWDFNYFVVQGGYLSSRGAVSELVGDLREATAIAKHLGLLARASACGGTVFFDEFNTLDPRDGNLFLRFAEEPHEIEVPGLPSPLGLDVLMVFASNKRPAELEREGWNPAVLTRVAKPGHYFEIPPLSARREDIAVASVYYLEQQEQKSRERNEVPVLEIERFELDALRLLCLLPWEGNYRQLMALLSRVVERHRRKPEQSLRRTHVTFEDLLGCYLFERE